MVQIVHTIAALESGFRVGLVWKRIPRRATEAMKPLIVRLANVLRAPFS